MTSRGYSIYASVSSRAMSLIEHIRHEFSTESDKDWKNTLWILFTTAALLLMALAVGRLLFYPDSSFHHALMNPEEEQDIVRAVTSLKRTKKEDKIDRKSQSIETKEHEVVPPLPGSLRHDSNEFEVPLVGIVSFSSSWERRKQTLAMFTCSLAFVLPMTLLCWTVTIYLAVVLPVQYRQQWSSSNESIYFPVPLILSSLTWMYLVFVYLIDLSEISGNRSAWLRGRNDNLLGKWLNQWWSWACDFLPVILVKTADLPATSNISTTVISEDGKATTMTKTTTVSNKYVLGYHPHGIIAVGAFCAFATDSARTLDLSADHSFGTETSKSAISQDKTTVDHSVFSSSTSDGRGFSSLYPNLDRRVVTLPQNFWTPFLREYFLFMGAVTSAKETFREYLQTFSKSKVGSSSNNENDDKTGGRAMIVVVGGASESMMAEQGSINLVLRNRRGFVREAIMAGASLVPVLGFGETDLYHFYNVTDENSFAAKLQRFIKKTFGFAAPMFRGRSMFLKDVGALPYRTPVIVVVGSPIAPPTRKELQGKDYQDFSPKIDRKTDTAMNEDGKILMEWHSRYVEQLEALYNQHKDAQWNVPGKARSKSMKILQ